MPHQKPQKNYAWPPFAKLLAWYGQHGRQLPWRTPLNVASPYAVWLAEIMLQQTTVTSVVPYYERFLARWPTIEGLAQASLPQIYEQWAGLGYYSRARNLHLCAQQVAQQGWPQTVGGLQKLPGVGPYTAASVAAIAFGVPVIPVDGNVARILARIFADSTPLPKGLAHFRAIAATANVPVAESDNMVQALMDLGATICTPRAPKCNSCPWQKYCAAYKNGLVETLPVRTKKTPAPRLHANSFVLLNKTGSHVLLQQQAATGLLGGLWLPPMSDWLPFAQASFADFSGAPLKMQWQKIDKNLVHIFTHKHLTVGVYTAQLASDYLPNDSQLAWHKLDDHKKWCTLTAKIVTAATAH